MSTPLLLHLNDEVLSALEHEAQATGASPESLAILALQERFLPQRPTTAPTRWEDDPFVRLFGLLPGAVPGGTDNDQIDEDLARAYGAELEEF